MSTEVLIPEVVGFELVPVARAEGLNEEQIARTLGAYKEYVIAGRDWIEQSAKVTDPDNRVHQKMAVECRKGLMRCRTAIEKVRQALNADLIREKKGIDRVAKTITEMLAPHEERMRAIEEAEERRERERIRILTEERAAKLQEVGADPFAYNLGVMDDATFETILDTAREVKRKKDEAAAEEERRKIEAEKEAERKRKEQEEELARLRKEREQRSEEDRKRKEAELLRQQEEERKRLAEKRAQEERDRQAQAEAEALKRKAREAEKRAKEAEEQRKQADARADQARRDEEAARLREKKALEEAATVKKVSTQVFPANVSPVPAHGEPASGATAEERDASTVRQIVKTLLTISSSTRFESDWFKKKFGARAELISEELEPIVKWLSK